MNPTYFEPLEGVELHNHLRLTLPPTSARLGWDLDETAILAALDYLGIEKPVRIRFMTTKRGATLGTHRSDVDRHRVTIAQNLKKAGDASLTLWHELVHCMQAERFATKTGKPMTKFHDEEYKLLDGEWGRTYQGNELEKEANRIAYERNVSHLLAK
jgi:hypothetical protein